MKSNTEDNMKKFRKAVRKAARKVRKPKTVKENKTNPAAVIQALCNQLKKAEASGGALEPLTIRIPQ